MHQNLVKDFNQMDMEASLNHLREGHHIGKAHLRLRSSTLVQITEICMAKVPMIEDKMDLTEELTDATLPMALKPACKITDATASTILKICLIDAMPEALALVFKAKDMVLAVGPLLNQR